MQIRYIDRMIAAYCFIRDRQLYWLKMIENRAHIYIYRASTPQALIELLRVSGIPSVKLLSPLYSMCQTHIYIESLYR